MIDWLIEQIERVWEFLFQMFNTELFELSGKPFSLSSITRLMLFAFVAFIIARILREWIRRTILVRFGLDRGTREAIASVIGYILTGFGFLIVLQSAGINLGSLTVIAGVLGIGFGFGLQPLASNFISGITLLFEQPLKVGDLVEVNDLLGIVEKISIRSTVIRTLDGVFVIAPNQSFVENNIINWSYRDPKCRIHIPVGIAYGSDTTLVTEAFLAAARNQPGVLFYPPPKVWFQEFGDSYLNFELLVWVDDPPAINQIRSDLNFAIENELEARGIETPFPQRDLHIKNVQEISQLFQGSPKGKTKEGENSEESSKLSKSKKTLSKSSQNQTLESLLRQVTYFQNCTRRQLRELIEDGYRQVFKAEQVICHEGDPGDSFYVILSGSVEIFSEKIGKHITNRYSGEFIGEMALLMGIPRSASIRTLEDTTLFVVNHTNLQKLLSKHKGLADQISEELAKRRESLESMGLLKDLMDSDENVFRWIRKRLNSIFDI